METNALLAVLICGTAGPRSTNVLYGGSRWYDGPLVTAMKNGDLILIDEISLTEDSVLERLNSVLETG
eukprot:3682716-Rhodomonas_salina.1